MPNFIAPAKASKHKTVRNRRLAWSVHGELPRAGMLTLAVLGFLLPFLAWCILSASGIVDPVFLPTPLKVVTRCYDWLVNDDLMSDIGISMGRVFGGFVASTVLALPVGILIGTYAPVRAAGHCRH